MLDFGPATATVSAVVAGVRDEQLERPTPCADMPVRALLDHLAGLSLAFTWAAGKQNDAQAGPPPAADGTNLPDDWRSVIPRRLTELADAWQNADAWTGMTRAGGLDLRGEVAGAVALDEVVLHGWDLAAATGQPFDASGIGADELAAVHEFVASIPPSGPERGGLFGPVVDVPAGAPLLHRILGLAGRDPAWTPAAG